MAVLIFTLPALILAIIGLLVYSAFALLFGSLALAGSATRIAPKSIGYTLCAGAIAFMVTFAWFRSGQLTEDAVPRNIETGMMFLFSLLIASVSMVLVAGVAAVNARVSDRSELEIKDPRVDRQIKQDIEAGGWGLRTTSYSDNQHEHAANRDPESAKRHARANSDSSIRPSTNSW